MKQETYYLLPQQRNKSKGMLTYYGGIVEFGRVRWVSLKTKNYKQALEWYNQMQSRRYAPEKQEKQPVNIESAADAFMQDIENTRKRVAGTVILYRKYLKQFRSFCKEKGMADVREATPSVCSEFAQAAFANLAAHTAKNKVTLFRQFFSWVQEHYGIEGKNPFKKIIVSKPKSAPRQFWTVEECEKIIAAAPNPEYKCWFALMAFAGLRMEEARHLKRSSIADGYIHLVGKGGKAAKVPISARLKTFLNAYLTDLNLPPNTPLFPALSKLCYARTEVLQKAAENAGIEQRGKAHYHRFRHSFASNLLRTGRSIKAVQMLMRHENVTLTLNIYGHLLPSDLEEAVEL